MKKEHAVRMLAAVAHEGRLTLLRRLISAGPEGVGAGELARFAKVNATTASAQLGVLANAGLVRSKRAGRSITYYAEYGAMQRLLGYLMKDCCCGSREICEPLAAEFAA